MNEQSPFGRSHKAPSVPTAAVPACSPVAGTAASLSDSNRRADEAATFTPGKPKVVGRGLGNQNETATLSKPWGSQPICAGCNRGAIYSCICNIPDPEPEYFKPGGNYDPEGGWAFAERSAFGMGVAK